MKFPTTLRGKILLIGVPLNLLLLCAALIYGAITREAISEGREAVECFIKHNFLIYCPGCGGSRSLAALLEFDVIRSFLYYPALPIATAILIYADVLAAVSFIRNTPSPLKKINFPIIIVIPIIIFATFFIRNILLIGFGIDTLGDVTNLISN